MPWQPGQSGNPKGRRPGVRAVLTDAVVKHFVEDFQKHGVDTIRLVRETKPEVYLGIIARFVPNNVELEVVDTRRSISEYSTSELIELLKHDSPHEIAAPSELIEDEDS